MPCNGRIITNMASGCDLVVGAGLQSTGMQGSGMSMVRLSSLVIHVTAIS